MSFLDGLGRFLNGKPVFEDEGQARRGPVHTSGSPHAQPPQSPHKTPVDSRGYKIIPKIRISNMKTSRRDNDMTTTAWITNTSNQKVRVDYCYVLGQKQVYNRELEPGAGHEVVVYRGKVASNEHNNKARIVYRLVSSDDLFEDEYFVEFYSETDGAFMLEEFHEEGPTRDI